MATGRRVADWGPMQHARKPATSCSQTMSRQVSEPTLLQALCIAMHLACKSKTVLSLSIRPRRRDGDKQKHSPDRARWSSPSTRPSARHSVQPLLPWHSRQRINHLLARTRSHVSQLAKIANQVQSLYTPNLIELSPARWKAQYQSRR